MNPSHNDLWENYSKDKSQHIRNQIVESYLNLVEKEARKIKTPIGIEQQDIYQFGVVGLMKAVDNYKFDGLKGARFESYAPYRIYGEIVDQLRKYANYSQGVSRTALKRMKEMEKVRNELELKKNDKVSEIEVMEFLNLDSKKISKYQFKNTIYNGVPIDDFYENPKYHKKHSELCLDPERQILTEETIKELKAYINLLKEKERFILEEHYFKKINFSNIAKSLNVSEARISQIHQEAITKLKFYLNQNND